MADIPEDCHPDDRNYYRMADIQVCYRSEGERPYNGPLQPLLDNLNQRIKLPPCDIQDIEQALDMWGGYQGSNGYHRFVIISLDFGEPR